VGAAGEAGDPRRNTGTVVLVAPTEREVRIELGYVTNTFISAARAGRIQDEYMLPAFREGDYGTGILLGVTALAQDYASHFGFELTGEVPALPERGTTRGGSPNRMLIFVVLIIIFFLLANRRRGGGGGGRRRRTGRAAAEARHRTHHPPDPDGRAGARRLRSRWLRWGRFRWRGLRRWRLRGLRRRWWFRRRGRGTRVVRWDNQQAHRY
jgi:uncharacterized membrane protein YgcG